MNKPRDSALVKLFLTSYDAFRVRLRRRLGSDDLANDVLQETYLRVDRMDATHDLQRPGAYLYRMALNVAADRREADARLLTGAEIEALLQVAEDQDPARIVGGQREIQNLLGALYELPARRRRIFIAARLASSTGADGGTGARDAHTPREPPLDIARRRYAAGEISREEFEQIKRDLA